MVLLLCSMILAVAATYSATDTPDIEAQQTRNERDLRRDIFYNYDKIARPVKRASSAVPVEINMSALRVKSLSEKYQEISLETWLKFKWTDEYLQWNPMEYDNITELHVPPTEIWRPDIALYTASQDTSLFPSVYTQAIVFNTGKVLWIPPFTMNSRCPVPFKNYANPGRTFVDCNIRMGSWTNSGKMLDLQLSADEVDLSNFLDYNPEWKLVNIASSRESQLYACCVDEYPFINFNITMKKRNS